MLTGERSNSQSPVNMETRTSRKMFLVRIVVNGVRCIALVDTGCSYELIFSPDKLKKYGLGAKKLGSKSVVRLGNNSTEQITHETTACIKIDSYATTMSGVLLQLGNVFDCVLGLPYLERLQEASDHKDDFKIDFAVPAISTVIKGNPVLLSSEPSVAHHCALTSATTEGLWESYNDIFEKCKHSQLTTDDLESGLICMIDNNGEIMETVDGDNTVAILAASSEKVSAQEACEYYYAMNKFTGPSTPHYCDNKFSEDADRIFMASYDDIAEEDPKSGETPTTTSVPTTTWKPAQPSKEDDFRDNDLFNRVQRKHNTDEELARLEQQGCKGLKNCLTNA